MRLPFPTKSLQKNIFETIAVYFILVKSIFLKIFTNITCKVKRIKGLHTNKNDIN